MSINRKDFLKALCLSGSCVSGFNPIALSKNIAGNHDVLSNEQGNNPVVIKEWISSLLQNYVLIKSKFLHPARSPISYQKFY